MTNEEICQAILAVKQSDITKLFNDLDSPEKETYKLCFNLQNLHLYFCESPNFEYCSEQDVILCVLTKNEILGVNQKSLIITKIENKFGVCDESKL